MENEKKQAWETFGTEFDSNQFPSVKTSSEPPEGKSSYLHGGIYHFSSSGKRHEDIDSDAGTNMFAAFDDSVHNPIAINPGLDGSRVFKIETKNKEKPISDIDGKSLIDFIITLPDNQEFDVDGMPMTKSEIIDFLERRIKYR